KGWFRQIDIHLLDVQILVDAPLAELPPDAALFVAAPRRLDVGRLHVVHPDDAGAQLLHGAHGAEDVARPHGSRETVVRVVRDPQRIALRVERNDGRDRPEDFFTRDPVRVVDVVEDRRLDEQAALETGDRGGSAADGDFRFLLADLLILADAIELLAAHERAQLRLAIERRSD